MASPQEQPQRSTAVVALVMALNMALVLGGCTQTASAPPTPPAGSAPPGVTPSSFKLPDGTGCAAEIDRFRAVLDNDVSVGHLTRAVYQRAASDLKQAEAPCAAGREVQARSIVSTTKRNYGYT